MTASLFDDMTPAGLRHDGPETSRAAALHAFRRGSQRHRLLAVYAEHPYGATDEMVCAEASIVGGWKRCSELRNLGLIEPTGGTLTSSMGAEQQLCAITFEGRRMLGLIDTDAS